MPESRLYLCADWELNRSAQGLEQEILRARGAGAGYAVTIRQLFVRDLEAEVTQS